MYPPHPLVVCIPLSRELLPHYGFVVTRNSQNDGADIPRETARSLCLEEVASGRRRSSHASKRSVSPIYSSEVRCERVDLESFDAIAAIQMQSNYRSEKTATQ
jgi:hypothetical protein